MADRQITDEGRFQRLEEQVKELQERLGDVESGVNDAAGEITRLEHQSLVDIERRLKEVEKQSGP